MERVVFSADILDEQGYAYQGVIHVDNESNPEIVDIAKYTYSSINPSLSTGSTLAYVGRLTKNDANWVFYRVSDMMLIKAEA